MKKNILTSVVIPTYNEEKVINNCLESLNLQSYKNLEIIVVDDGSRDETARIVENLKLKIKNLILIKQNHEGPGNARNLGASRAKGEIFVFVDADMTFEKEFINDLIKPILKGTAKGTFSKNEFNANSKNIWSACWNINKNLPKNLLIPRKYPNTAPVFRAILKKEFEKVGGFDTNGQYTDDWSLSKNLGYYSKLASGATYYHYNPSTLNEIWLQARWIGKNEFISGSLERKVKSLVLYSLPFSLLIGIYKSIINRQIYFLLFKIWYDFAVFISVLKSFFKENKIR